MSEEHKKKKKRIVIVGGGWAGFSAADALASHPDPSELEIILLDASPRVWPVPGPLRRAVDPSRQGSMAFGESTEIPLPRWNGLG